MSDETPREEHVPPAETPRAVSSSADETSPPTETAIPRRSKPKHAPPPSGYRSTRRNAKAMKTAKRAEAVQKVSQPLARTGKFIRDLGYYLFLTLGAILVALAVLFIVAYGVNGFARWNAKRIADKAGTMADLEKRSQENVLVIATKDGQATGFLALRVNRKNNQTFGVAIPDGAFIEVPGQGFQKIGESYRSGPDTSLAAISNYLMVPFHLYIIVPDETYQSAMKNQSIASILTSSTASNLSAARKQTLAEDMAAIPKANTAIVPLPVNPIRLGTETYFEPQAQQVADLIKAWWGVDMTKQAKVTRVILYNGAGTPGIAGAAAQQLLRAGFRVVDTKNADNFNYATTQVIVQRGDVSQGQAVVKALGVGTVKNQPADQNVTDVIVIIGKDYKPPAGGATGGTP